MEVLCDGYADARGEEVFAIGQRERTAEPVQMRLASSTTS